MPFTPAPPSAAFAALLLALIATAAKDDAPLDGLADEPALVDAVLRVAAAL
jgi:hypothetical protein